MTYDLKDQPGRISYDLAVMAALDEEDRAKALESDGNKAAADYARLQARSHQRRARHIQRSFSLTVDDLDSFI